MDDKYLSSTFLYTFIKMENNINMDYRYLVIVLCFLILLAIILCILYIRTHLIVIANIENNDIEVKIEFKCFFNLIDITKKIYPIDKSKKRKSGKTMDKKIKLQMIQLENLVVVYKSIRRMRINEVYSNLSYGSEYINFTSFIYVLVNVLYGNLFDYLDSKKMYLKVTPCYNKNFIKYKGIVHINPTIKDIIILVKGVYKIYIDIKSYKKVKYNEEGINNEISKFDKEHNGYNA